MTSLSRATAAVVAKCPEIMEMTYCGAPCHCENGLKARPIQLADVLRAMATTNMRHGNFEIDCTGKMTVFGCSDYVRSENGMSGYFDIPHWNLALPLSGQSDETCVFITSLLK